MARHSKPFYIRIGLLTSSRQRTVNLQLLQEEEEEKVGESELLYDLTHRKPPGHSSVRDSIPCVVFLFHRGRN